jgi:hypothetical protein
MATADEYAQWIIDNQANQNSPEFRTVAAAYKDAKMRESKVSAVEQYSESVAKEQKRIFDELPWYQQMAVGAGKSAVDLGRGVGQLAGVVSREDIDEAEAIDKNITGWGTAGQVLGTVGQLAIPFGAGAGLARLAPAGSKLAAAGQGLANVVTKAPLSLKGAAQQGALGGSLGAIQPVSSDESRTFNSALGAVGGAILPLAGAGFKAVRRAMEPVTSPQIAAARKLVEDAGGEQALADAIQKAQAAGMSMSGSPYTLGQAGKSAGLSATERARAAVNPENFQPIYQGQTEARIGALRGIAQDDTALLAAKESRDEAAKAVYDPAFASDLQRQSAEQATANATRSTQTGGIGGVGDAPVNLDPRLSALRGNPVIDAAKRDAQTLAKTFGKDIGDPMQSLEGLHYIKLAIDSQLNKPVANTSLGSYSDAALKSTKARLMDAIVGTENAPGISPMYGSAVKQYAEMSKPINQMQVGRSLMDTLVGEATKYGANPKQQAEAYFRALKNAPALIKKETGMSMPLERIMTPEQMATLRKIGEDLARKVDAENLGRGVGSDTAQKLARGNIASNMMAEAAKGRLWRVGEFASNLANFRVGGELDKMLQNPETAQQGYNALAELIARRAIENPNTNALRAIGIQGTTQSLIGQQ